MVLFWIFWFERCFVILRSITRRRRWNSWRYCRNLRYFTPFTLASSMLQIMPIQLAVFIWVWTNSNRINRSKIFQKKSFFHTFDLFDFVIVSCPGQLAWPRRSFCCIRGWSLGIFLIPFNQSKKHIKYFPLTYVF